MQQRSYYDRYRQQALLFEGIGIVLLAAAILINELTGRHMGLPVILPAAAGMFFLVTGGSGARPHTMVKSFALLLKNDPCRKNAEEFCLVMEKVKHVSLTKQSRMIVESGLKAYEDSPERDDELVKKLRETAGECIKNRIF